LTVSAIRLCGISNFVLEGVDFDINEGELLVVVGPSGAGKTTLLNVIAGLVVYHGKVMFDGRPVDCLPPHRREVGYLFQDLLLFPHLTVEKNLLLAMARLDLGRRERQTRTEEILSLFRLGSLAARLPGDLSGGEKQRAAFARAVASRPRVLLLDEPFASLDFRTARYLRQEFRDLQKKLAMTTLFVTHNLHEALELADRIAVLRAGRLERIGRPDEIWFAGESENDFLERPNLLVCKDQTCLGNGLVRVQWAGLSILVPDEGRTFSRLAILPHEVYISSLPPPGPPINRFKGEVKAIRQNDGAVQVTIQVGEESLRAEISRGHLNAMNLAPGARVHGILKLRALRGLG
jgi:molybdopterin-binding protein